MTRRTLILILLTVGVIAFAWFNPPPLPEPPADARYVKISADGRELQPWDGPWSCVLDTRTALVWEVKSYAEDMHDYQCSFSWFDSGLGVADGGSCFTEDEKSDTRDLIEHANDSERCGIRGWRLPTENELNSLLSDSPLPGDVLIARDYFPYTQQGLYWTSEAEVPLTGYFARLGKGAVSIDFKNGESKKMPYRDAAFVRLVAEAGAQ